MPLEQRHTPSTPLKGSENTLHGDGGFVMVEDGAVDEIK